MSRVVVALISEPTAKVHLRRSEGHPGDAAGRDRGRLIPVHLSADVELPYGTEQLHALHMFADGDVGTVAARIAATVPQAPPAGEPLRNDRTRRRLEGR